MDFIKKIIEGKKQISLIIIIINHKTILLTHRFGMRISCYNHIHFKTISHRLRFNAHR